MLKRNYNKRFLSNRAKDSSTSGFGRCGKPDELAVMLANTPGFVNEAGESRRHSNG